MNCPYCSQSMAAGYLKDERGYSLMWTDDPFKVTDIPLGSDILLCKVTDVDKPKAYLCRSCRKKYPPLRKERGISFYPNLAACMVRKSSEAIRPVSAPVKSDTSSRNGRYASGALLPSVSTAAATCPMLCAAAPPTDTP